MSTRYFTGKPCKKGHIADRLTSSGECVQCKQGRERQKYNPEYRKNHYGANRERLLLAQQVRDTERHEEKLKYGKQWRDRNKEYTAEYRKQNAGLFAFHAALRRKRVVLATPKWVDLDKIKELYLAAAKAKMHVDHIVPLAGKTVCGLHVPWNLQLLTEEENRKKKNKFSD